MCSKIKKAYVEGGVQLILASVKTKLFRKNSAWWFTVDLAENTPEVTTHLHNVVVSKDNPEQVIEYLKKKDYFVLQEYETAQQYNHWLIGLFVNGEVKGFCKLGFTKIYITDFHQIISFPKNFAFIYEYEIDESMRGKGIAKYFVSQVLSMIKHADRQFAGCHVPLWNVASMKVVMHCGFKRQFKLLFMEIVGIKLKTYRLQAFLNSFVKK